MKKDKVLVFLVSQQWQVENFILLSKKSGFNHNDILFLCTDLITHGNSYRYLTSLPNFSFVMLPKCNKSFLISSIISTSFILKTVKSRFRDELRKIIFISDNFENVHASALRNLSLLYNFKLFFLQHGENYFSNRAFDYSNGWYLLRGHCLSGFKKRVLDFILLFVVSVTHFKLNKIFCIFKIAINLKYSYLSFANKIFVTNQKNKDWLVSCGINGNKVHIVGSILIDKYSGFLENEMHFRKFNFLSVVVYSSGSYRKTLSASDRLNQKLFFNNIFLACQKFRINCIFKLKTDEEFKFKKDFPGLLYFSNNNDYLQYLEKNQQVLHVFPVDSTMTLEFSLMKIPYVTFAPWDSLSDIGLLNLKSCVEVLHYAIHPELLERKMNIILNNKMNIKSICYRDLELIL
jgi:hypothetical protein